MMNQERWKKLEKAFEQADKFKADDFAWGEWADESDFEGLNLMDWLECSSTRPDHRMWEEFEKHGYSVFAAEKDSFGWLVGAVKRIKDPSRRITFG